MVNPVYQSQKRPLFYSKKKISKAGRLLRKGGSDDEEMDAIEKIQDFRASHSYPLMLIKNHLWRTAKKVDEDVIIARRLKRLPTILNKLRRPSLDGDTSNSIDIIRMQDIGGCRAILKTQEDVYALLEKLKKSRSAHRIKRITDYMKNPKKSGYRGIHIIYSCFENQDNANQWRGHKVEVQLRTKSQHAWSTAVELVDLYEKTNLKTATLGDDEWRSFFQSLSYPMHVIENVKEEPNDEYTIFDIFDANTDNIDERTEKYKSDLENVKAIANKLNVIAKLVSYSMALDSVSLENKKNGVYVLAIYNDVSHFRGELHWFTDKNRDKANDLYDSYELDDSVYQTVLVGAQGAGTLAQAYPNFFADTRSIVSFLSVILEDNKFDVPLLMTRRIDLV